MHNGSVATIEDVIEFYGEGAQKFEQSGVDFQVEMGFSLTKGETEDMINFLYALVDETIPEEYWEGLNYIDSEGHILIPDAVPSGSNLVVKAFDNPARAFVAEVEAAPNDRPECVRDPSAQTVTVSTGQTIQQAVDCAEQGDTILVPPGIYKERVVIDTNGITLRGITDEPDMCPVQTTEAIFLAGDAAPNWPILEGDVDGDGESDLSDGVIASSNNFTMEYFVMRNYTGNGVLVDGSRNVTIRHTYSENAGLYGVYTVRSTNVLVECNVGTLMTDAAIYVGQSRDIVVRNNLVYDNIAGIEIENSAYAKVYENETWDNVGGLLVFLLTNLRSRVSTHVDVYDNYVHDNNRSKGDTNTGLVAMTPIGTGVLLLGTDYSEVYNNRIENNDSYGIAIPALYMVYERDQIENVGPLAEYNYIHDNIFVNNGANPDPFLTDAGLPGADLLWDTESYGNLWDEPGASRFPPLLPGSGWPKIAQRAIFRIWNFIAQLL
jgi:cytochrome c peroxidase